MGRFHAKWLRQNPTPDGEPFPILNAKGKGHWCGYSAGMQGYHPSLGFLEGDEMLWIDDRDKSFFHGTGTEDYFNGGWYFGGTGCFPYSGCGVHQDSQGRCHAYRIHVSDVVPFQRTARIAIEHGPANDVPADYCGTTFWYAAPETVAETAELLPMVRRLWMPTRLAGCVEAEDP